MPEYPDTNDNTPDRLTASRPRVPPVFVVDDDPVARVLVCERLKEAGLANPLWWADDIPGAVDWLDASAADPPALVLLDVHLPSGTGLDLLRWMRTQDHLAAAAVIVLSASAEMDEISSGHDLGVRSYLVKPVGLSALGEVVRSLDEPWALMGQSPAASPTTSPAPAAPEATGP